jgi:phenylpyruvate tautomerase PptA (4-oxalocrotonate tautomerase family)
MPIVDVEIVAGPDDAAPPAGLARVLADAIGECLEAPAGGTWVRLRMLGRDGYAESGGGPPGPPPVFVTVLSRHGPEGDRLSSIVAELTAAVAGATGRPSERVHVIFEPHATGRVAFGGQIVE